MSLDKEKLQRIAIAKSFNPIENALIDVIFNFRDLEREIAASSSGRAEVEWTSNNHPVGTQELIEQILSRRPYVLPLHEPNSPVHEILSLQIATPEYDLVAPDIRITNQRDLLIFQSNIGSLQGSEPLWSRTTRGCGFPHLCC